MLTKVKLIDLSKMYFCGIINNTLQNYKVNVFLFFQHIGIGIGVMARCSHYQRHEEVKMTLCRVVTSGEKEQGSNRK